MRIDARTMVPLVHEFALVTAGGDGAELVELAEAASGGIAVFVLSTVEGGRPAAVAVAVAAVGFLVFLDRDDGLDPALAQARLAAEEYALSPIAAEPVPLTAGRFKLRSAAGGGGGTEVLWAT